MLGLAPDEPDVVPSTDADLATLTELDRPADRAEVGPHDLSHPGPARPRSRRPRSARQVAVLLLAAVGLGAVLGWTTTGSVGATQNDEDAVVGLDATATIVDVRSVTIQGARAGADVQLRVRNTGDVPLTVLGAAKGFSAGRIDSLSRDPLVVEPRTGQDVDLRVTVACDSAERLTLPPLTVRRQDGTLRSLDVQGAAATLAELCRRGDPSGHLLAVTAVTREDDGAGARLMITVTVPNGRTLRLTGIAVGGVPLTGTPLPVTLDTPKRTIWLDPPSSCAPAWRAQGVPETFDLTVSTSPADPSPVHLDQPGGLALADWLLTSACGGTG